MRLHSAFEQQKGSGHVFFFWFWGHSRLWPQNQKKASRIHFNENMVRKVYTAKISGPYQLFYGPRPIVFSGVNMVLQSLFFSGYGPELRRIICLTRIFQRITRLIRINRLYCEYGQCKLLKGFVRLLM